MTTLITDRREVRGAIKLNAGSGPMPPNVDQLQFREMSSEAPDDVSEREGETDPGKRLAESLNQIVEKRTTP